jgi:hypothetical protein
MKVKRRVYLCATCEQKLTVEVVAGDLYQFVCRGCAGKTGPTPIFDRALKVSQGYSDIDRIEAEKRRLEQETKRYGAGAHAKAEDDPI